MLGGCCWRGGLDLNPLKPLLMLGTMGHRWLVAQAGTRVVPSPRAMLIERINLHRGVRQMALPAESNISVSQDLRLFNNGGMACHYQ